MSSPPTGPSAADSPARQLLRLATPVIGLQVLNVLAVLVDTVMCGNLPGDEGSEALIALGYAGQITFMLIVLMIGLNVGAVALVARAHGAGARDRVQHIVQQSAQLTVYLGVAVTVGGAIIAEPLLRVLGSTEAVTAAGLRYLYPLLLSTTPLYLRMLYGSLLRGVGNTRLPFIVAAVVNALNVGLNYGLIFGVEGVVPSLGVMGAAIGTGVAQVVGLVMLWAWIRVGGEPAIEVKAAWDPIDKPLAKELSQVGTPAALDMTVLNLALLVIVGLLGRANELAVAAHGIGMRVQSLAFVPGLGFSQATGALAGQGLGASEVPYVRRVVRASVFMSVGVLTIIGILIAAFAYPLVSVFGAPAGSELAELSVTWMYLLSAGMPLVGLYLALNGLFQGAGRTGIGLRINILTTVAFQVPLSFLLGPMLGFGPAGVWLAFPASYVLKVSLAGFAYKRGSWSKTGLHA